MSPPEILVLAPAPPDDALDAARAEFACHGPFADPALATFLRESGARIDGIVTTGKARLDAAMLDLMPSLRIVACFSAGTDALDAAALAARGIPLSTTGAALADDVADLAIALMLMARRRLVQADSYARGGAWRSAEFPLGQSAAGRRLGLLGFGNIGQAVARRGSAMRMLPRYCARAPRSGCGLPYCATPLDLARDSDVLLVACPGGGGTRGLVSAEVIAALGPHGTLVNIARGGIVDQPALVTALSNGSLGSAGLDVLDGEPAVPPDLAALPNVVLTPHIGSATVATRTAMGEAMLRSLLEGLGRPSARAP